MFRYGFGSRTGATPDGRRKGEEFSKNILRQESICP